MSRWIIVSSLLLASLVIFTPPGLCPCWLMIDIAAAHPHPSGHPEQPHSHNYLLDLFSAQFIITATLSFTTASTLLKILTAALSYRLGLSVKSIQPKWRTIIEPPPPRQFQLTLLPQPTTY